LIVRLIRDGTLPVYGEDPPDAVIVGVAFTRRDPIEESTFEIRGWIRAGEAPALDIRAGKHQQEGR
jgi:hypothetical protein